MLDEEHPHDGELVRGVNTFLFIATEIDGYVRSPITYIHRRISAPLHAGRLGGATP